MKKKLVKSFITAGALLAMLTSCSDLVPPGPQGEQGIPGVSVESIEKTGSEGNVDIYTITYSDGTTTTFTVTNGEDGEKGDPGYSPVVTVGENGNWYVDGVDTGARAEGIDGIYITGIELIKTEGNIDTYRIFFNNGNYFDFVVTNGTQGEVGASVLTGEGAPSNDLGRVNDSYIDTATWNYYLKTSNGWELKGNIRGSDGSNGISVESAYIDDNGELIVTLSNGQTINAGVVIDTRLHTVKFYLDELLVDAQIVKHGERLTSIPEVEGFTVKHWYIDKDYEYEWLWYGFSVTQDMTLYGNYQTIMKTLSFDKTANIYIDSYEFGTTLVDNKELCVSKASYTNDYLSTLESRGILFNRAEIGAITDFSVDIDSDGFSSATLYYGKNPFSFDNSIDLFAGNNVLNLNKAEYFTIRNNGNDPIHIKSVNLQYGRKTRMDDEGIPTIVINTNDNKQPKSTVDYSDCVISTKDAEIDVKDVSAQIRLYSNSSAYTPKKPFRIKLDSKESLFGYDAAKNWLLLSDYMDGSNMHNYTALKFSKLLRGNNSFGNNPTHVNVVLNSDDVGIYTFCEFADETEGRLDLEQDKLWEKDFDQINFYIERDYSVINDPTQTLDETYFKVPLHNYPIAQYYFALRYPEKADFAEVLPDQSINYHEAKFQAFFDALKAYMTDVCNRFASYRLDKEAFYSVAEVVDVDSLATFAAVDQAFNETDHSQKGFKMYRKDGGLLQFGPNFEYESCAYSLPYQGTYVLDPFKDGAKYNHYYLGDIWGQILYYENTLGRPHIKSVWDNFTLEQINTFIEDQLLELKAISHGAMFDCSRWMHNQYFALFDNQLYYWWFINDQLPLLKGYYS